MACRPTFSVSHAPGLVLGGVQDRELLGDLVAHLQSIASVDEHAGGVRADDGEPGRSRETCKPGKAFIGGRNEFALKPVRARHEKCVEARFRHGFAQRCKARWSLFRAGGGIEGLEHGRQRAGTVPGRKRERLQGLQLAT